MIRTSFLAFIFAMEAFTAAFAQANSPVTINSCGPKINPNSQQTVGGIPLTSTSSGIEIEFVNESAKTADLVNFAVDSNDRRFVIRDVGTFSPGVSIKHHYENGSGQAFVLPQFISPRITCKVASVHFTDGTVWERGAGIRSSSASQSASSSGAAGPLSASPANVSLESTAESQLFLVSSSERVSAFKETDNCTGVASVFVAATGQSTATYSVKPTAPGSCTAQIVDEAGHTISIPITISSNH